MARRPTSIQQISGFSQDRSDIYEQSTDVCAESEVEELGKKREEHLRRLFEIINKLPETDAAALEMQAEMFLVDRLRAERIKSGPPGGKYYAHRNKAEYANVIDFIRDVYGSAGWLDGYFTQSDLRKIDEPCAGALDSYVNSHGRERVLELINLPTLAELNSRFVQHESAARVLLVSGRLHTARLRRTG